MQLIDPNLKLHCKPNCSWTQCILPQKRKQSHVNSSHSRDALLLYKSHSTVPMSQLLQVFQKQTLLRTPELKHTHIYFMIKYVAQSDLVFNLLILQSFLSFSNVNKGILAELLLFVVMSGAWSFLEQNSNTLFSIE